jgi:hypothetical protein
VARTLLVFGFCSLLVGQSEALAQSAVAQPAAPAAAIDWRFAHPDADMKMSINLQALLNSPAVAKAIEQGRAQAKENAMQFDLVVALLRQVDRVSVSVREKAALKAAGAKDPDVLVQVTGSFDPQMIAGFFPSTGKGKVKVVGPHTILIGEGDSFALAAGRMTETAAPVPGDELDQNDIWIATSYSFVARQTNGADKSMPPALRNLQGISVGLNVGEAPEFNVLLTAADAAGAGEILKMFQEMMGQMAQSNAAAGAAAKALDLKLEGAKLRMHYVLPPEVLAMAQQQAASSGLPAQLAPLLSTFGMGSFGAATPAKGPAGTVSIAPPPDNGGKIMIYGLDSGPKEVPVQK